MRPAAGGPLTQGVLALWHQRPSGDPELGGSRPGRTWTPDRGRGLESGRGRQAPAWREAGSARKQSEPPKACLYGVAIILSCLFLRNQRKNPAVPRAARGACLGRKLRPGRQKLHVDQRVTRPAGGAQRSPSRTSSRERLCQTPWRTLCPKRPLSHLRGSPVTAKPHPILTRLASPWLRTAPEPQPPDGPWGRRVWNRRPSTRDAFGCPAGSRGSCLMTSPAGRARKERRETLSLPRRPRRPFLPSSCGEEG